MKKTSKPGKANPTAGGAAKPTAAMPASRTTAGAAQKNSKETFQKKLTVCQRTYDYKDESRDVKGKTERLNAINEIQTLLQD